MEFSRRRPARSAPREGEPEATPFCAIGYGNIAAPDGSRSFHGESPNIPSDQHPKAWLESEGPPPRAAQKDRFPRGADGSSSLLTTSATKAAPYAPATRCTSGA